MKIKRVEHVATAVHRLSDVARVFEDKLGLTLEYEESLPQRQKNMRLLDERPRRGHGGALIAFLDPRSTADVLIELVQVPQERDGAMPLHPR